MFFSALTRAAYSTCYNNSPAKLLNLWILNLSVIFLLLLRTLSSVLRTALCAVSYTGSIKCTAYDVIANTRKVLYTTAAYKHD